MIYHDIFMAALILFCNIKTKKLTHSSNTDDTFFTPNLKYKISFYCTVSIILGVQFKNYFFK